MKEKNIGDKVWQASFGIKPFTIECPVCFKTGWVTLVLGNGEQVKTECEYCVRGFSEPMGVVEEYQRFSDVREVVIGGKEVTENENGRTIEYRTSENHSLHPGDNMFDTKEEAENRAKVMIKEYEDSEVQRLSHRKKSNQSHYSWSVGYYKKRIKEAQRDIDFYSGKLIELNEKKP